LKRHLTIADAAISLAQYHEGKFVTEAPGNITEEKVKSVGGLNIVFRSWRPARNPRDVVVIVPGFNSHSGYYGWVAEQFVASGLAVYAVDLRGRGKSDGERFYVDAFAGLCHGRPSLAVRQSSR
jgi:alpha-beta hydrolase superfamily lysophospholipase